MEYNCADDFVLMKLEKKEVHHKIINLPFFSGGQVLIVGFVLYFLNKEKPKKKKNN